MDTHVDSRTYTKKTSSEPICLFMYHSLCFAIYDKVRGEKFGTHVYQLLEHKPLVILFARLSLFSLSYPSIPVTKSQCVWPDYNGYRNTEWARSKYLFIVKEQIPVSNYRSYQTHYPMYPELILLLPSNGKIHLRTKAHLPV